MEEFHYGDNLNLINSDILDIFYDLFNHLLLNDYFVNLQKTKIRINFYSFFI